MTPSGSLIYGSIHGIGPIPEDLFVLLWFNRWRWILGVETSNCQLPLLPGSEDYSSQTKILDGRKNLSECVFEALFNGL
jgi:hypothetical protein